MKVTLGTSSWKIYSNELFFRDETPEKDFSSLFEVVSTWDFSPLFEVVSTWGWSWGKIDKASHQTVIISHHNPPPPVSIPWSNPNSDPIGDLNNSIWRYTPGEWKVREWDGHSLKFVWKDEVASGLPTIFSDDQTAVAAPDGTVPLDEQGRPVLDNSGGMVKRQKRYCHAGHGELKPGGWCKRCR